MNRLERGNPSEINKVFFRCRFDDQALDKVLFWRSGGDKRASLSYAEIPLNRSNSFSQVCLHNSQQHNSRLLPFASEVPQHEQARIETSDSANNQDETWLLYVVKLLVTISTNLPLLYTIIILLSVIRMVEYVLTNE